MVTLEFGEEEGAKGRGGSGENSLRLGARTFDPLVWPFVADCLLHIFAARRNDASHTYLSICDLISVQIKDVSRSS